MRSVRGLFVACSLNWSNVIQPSTFKGSPKSFHSKQFQFSITLNVEWKLQELSSESLKTNHHKKANSKKLIKNICN